MTDKQPDFSRLQANAAQRNTSIETPERRGPGRPSKATARASLEKRLTEQFGAMGMTVAIFDPYCGQTIIIGSERLAHALARLAEENPSVRRVLNASLQGSAWLELIVAVGMIAIPISAHHGLLPSDIVRNAPFPLGPQIPDYPPDDLNGDGNPPAA